MIQYIGPMRVGHIICIQTLQTLLPHSISFPAAVYPNRDISLGPLDLPNIDLVWRLKSVLDFNHSRPSRYPSFFPDQASIGP